MTQNMVCSRCGSVAEYSVPNLVALGEELCLCDRCLNDLLDFLTTPFVRIDNTAADVNIMAETESITLTTTTVAGKPTEVVIEYERRGRPCSYFKWDEYNLDKLMGFMREHLSRKEIARRFAVSVAAVNGILSRIRNSDGVGDSLAKYKRQLDCILNAS